MKFIETKYGLVKKETVTGLIREKTHHPWDKNTHYDIVIHLQGTEIRLDFDSEFERNTELKRIVEELEKED